MINHFTGDNKKYCLIFAIFSWICILLLFFVIIFMPYGPMGGVTFGQIIGTILIIVVAFILALISIIIGMINDEKNISIIIGIFIGLLALIFSGTLLYVMFIGF